MNILLDDVTFAKLAHHFKPPLDVTSERGKNVQKRIDRSLRFMAGWIGAMESERPTFAEYAEAGRMFLKGLKARQDFNEFALSTFAEGAGLNLPPMQVLPADKTLFGKIQAEIDALEVVAEFTDDSSAKRDGPNSKPWQHRVVSDLYLIWCDEGQSSRKQRDFFDFAEDVLSACHVGLTRFGIESSFKRKAKEIVADRMEFRKLIGPKIRKRLGQTAR